MQLTISVVGARCARMLANAPPTADLRWPAGFYFAARCYAVTYPFEHSMRLCFLAFFLSFFLASVRRVALTLLHYNLLQMWLETHARMHTKCFRDCRIRNLANCSAFNYFNSNEMFFKFQSIFLTDMWLFGSLFWNVELVEAWSHVLRLCYSTDWYNFVWRHLRNMNRKCSSCYHPAQNFKEYCAWTVRVAWRTSRSALFHHECLAFSHSLRQKQYYEGTYVSMQSYL